MPTRSITLRARMVTGVQIRTQVTWERSRAARRFAPPAADEDVAPLRDLQQLLGGVEGHVVLVDPPTLQQAESLLQEPVHRALPHVHLLGDVLHKLVPDQLDPQDGRRDPAPRRAPSTHLPRHRDDLPRMPSVSEPIIDVSRQILKVYGLLLSDHNQPRPTPPPPDPVAASRTCSPAASSGISNGVGSRSDPARSRAAATRRCRSRRSAGCRRM